MNRPRGPVESLMVVTNRPEMSSRTVRAHGSFDSTGKRYLDFVQGWAVNSLGHCRRRDRQAMAGRRARSINPTPAFYNAPIAFADLLAHAPASTSVFLANSGAEANEGAIKLARKVGQEVQGREARRVQIITFDGRVPRPHAARRCRPAARPAGTAIYATARCRASRRPTLNDIASVERLIDDTTVAVMLEPIQGEGGVIPGLANSCSNCAR